MKLHKQCQKPHLGTVSNIDLLRMAAYQGRTSFSTSIVVQNRGRKNAFVSPFLSFEGSKVSRVYAVVREIKSIFYQLYKLHFDFDFDFDYIKISCYRLNFKSKYTKKFVPSLLSCFFFFSRKVLPSVSLLLDVICF